METASIASSVSTSTYDARTLLDICRSPVPCPIGACRQMVGITGVLTHLLRDHSSTFGSDDIQELHADQSSLMIVYEQYFVRNDTSVVGVLIYGGRKGANERPADVGLCRANSFLPERFAAFATHLPVLIMACRTAATALLATRKVDSVAEMGGKGAEDGNKVSDSDSDYADVEDADADEILVFWLATVQTTRPLHCTITVFSNDLRTSRSCIVPVRDLKDSQDPRDFLPNESSCLVLRSGELKLLQGDDADGSFELEILLHEIVE